MASELACPPPPSRFVRTSARPTLAQLRQAFEEVQKLPVYQVS